MDYFPNLFWTGLLSIINIGLYSIGIPIAVYTVVYSTV